jgi:hypothetical protein
MWKGFWPRQLRDALGRTGKTQPTGVERHVVEGWVVNLGGGQPLAQQFGDRSPAGAYLSREMVIASGCGSRAFAGSSGWDCR